MTDTLSLLLSLVGLTLVTVAAVIVASYWTLALAGCRAPDKSVLAGADSPESRFVILIPAHDEETCIAASLRSCKSLSYPKDLYEIVVIADNCTDDTACIARQLSVRCIERVDPTRRGKGFALGYAIDQLVPETFDCIVVVDADCELDPDTLYAFDRRLRAGARVLQASDEGSNQDESAVSYFLAIGNVLENRFFWLGKEAQRRFVMLRGTGMAIHRTVLRELPWRSFSAVEDAEFSIHLATLGERVSFVPEAAVRSRFPTTIRELLVQRERWSAGTSTLLRHRLAPLVWNGLRTRNGLTLDAALTCLQLSRSVLLATVVVGTSTSVAGRLLGESQAGDLGLVVAAGASFGLAGYVMMGVIATGLSGRRMRLLIGAPYVIASLVLVAARGAVRRRAPTWTRTPRGK